jgi:hypothetical protein
MCWLSRNSGASTSWNPKGPSRPVAGKLYLYWFCEFCVAARGTALHFKMSARWLTQKFLFLRANHVVSKTHHDSWTALATAGARAHSLFQFLVLSVLRDVSFSFPVTQCWVTTRDRSTWVPLGLAHGAVYVTTRHDTTCSFSVFTGRAIEMHRNVF